VSHHSEQSGTREALDRALDVMRVVAGELMARLEVRRALEVRQPNGRSKKTPPGEYEVVTGDSQRGPRLDGSNRVTQQKNSGSSSNDFLNSRSNRVGPSGNANRLPEEFTEAPRSDSGPTGPWISRFLSRIWRWVSTTGMA
jgi:hypothetical protein